MSANRHPIEQEELMAYLDGELPTHKATEALSHLELCPECQTLVADFRGVSQELMDWEVESPGAGIPEEINAALGERLQKRQAASGKGQLAEIGKQSDDEPLGLGRGLGYPLRGCGTEVNAYQPQSE
jgi:anti-sigma factor RsiW